MDDRWNLGHDCNDQNQRWYGWNLKRSHNDRNQRWYRNPRHSCDDQNHRMIGIRSRAQLRWSKSRMIKKT